MLVLLLLAVSSSAVRGQSCQSTGDPALTKPPNQSSNCCGVDVSVSNHRIIPGNVATMEDYPWLTLIEHLGHDGQIKLLCTGSLISSRYVLTAAHCVVGPVLNIGNPANIRLGEYNASNEGRDCTVDLPTDCNDPPVTISIESTIVHPEYHPGTINNNIALIKMKENAPFTDFIRPICLPETDVTANPPENSKLFAAGWGAINAVENSLVKLHFKLSLVDKQKCQSAYSALGRRGNITVKHVCAGGERERDSCRSDLSGPLMFFNKETRRFELIGLFSHAKLCGAETFPRVYTKVFEYKDWIYRIIGI